MCLKMQANWLFLSLYGPIGAKGTNCPLGSHWLRGARWCVLALLRSWAGMSGDFRRSMRLLKPCQGSDGTLWSLGPWGSSKPISVEQQQSAFNRIFEAGCPQVPCQIGPEKGTLSPLRSPRSECAARYVI